MASWFVGLAFLTGAWGAPGDGSGEAEATPEVRREVRRPYPRPLFDDWSGTHRCSVRVTLDDKGRPSDLAPEDCDDASLFDWTARRVKRDRWEAPVADGTEVVVDVVYEPPVDTMELPDPSYWRRRELGACEAHVVVDPDGAPAVKEVDDGCDVELAPWSDTPEAPLKVHPPAVCPVTFLVVDGEVSGLDLFRCGVGLWGHVREGLEDWTFPSSSKPVPWTVLLQFDGPEAVMSVDEEIAEADAP